MYIIKLRSRVKITSKEIPYFVSVIYAEGLYNEECSELPLIFVLLVSSSYQLAYYNVIL